jgi:hypothetical protein
MFSSSAEEVQSQEVLCTAQRVVLARLAVRPDVPVALVNVSIRMHAVAMYVTANTDADVVCAWHADLARQVLEVHLVASPGGTDVLEIARECAAAGGGKADGDQVHALFTYKAVAIDPLLVGMTAA